MTYRSTIGLEIWLKSDVLRILRGVNSANRDIADEINTREMRIYRRGFEAALKATAEAFGIPWEAVSTDSRKSQPSQRLRGFVGWRIAQGWREQYTFMLIAGSLALLSAAVVTLAVIVAVRATSQAIAANAARDEQRARAEQERLRGGRDALRLWGKFTPPPPDRPLPLASDPPALPPAWDLSQGVVGFGGEEYSDVPAFSDNGFQPDDAWENGP